MVSKIVAPNEVEHCQFYMGVYCIINLYSFLSSNTFFVSLKIDVRTYVGLHLDFKLFDAWHVFVDPFCPQKKARCLLAYSNTISKMRKLNQAFGKKTDAYFHDKRAHYSNYFRAMKSY